MILDEKDDVSNSVPVNRNKIINLTDVSFSWVCPVIDQEFRHSIVKVVCG